MDEYAAEVRTDIDAALTAVSDKTAELTEEMEQLTENVRERLEEIRDVTTDKRGSEVRYTDGTGIAVVYLTGPAEAAEEPVVAASKAYADKLAPYDRIVRTQTEFESLIASPDWLGAESVAFKGTFVKSGDGIKVSAGVRTIVGLDGAVIKIQNHTNANYQGGFGYGALPGKGASVRGLTVEIESAAHKVNAFYRCRNLENCRAVLRQTGGGSAGYGECADIHACTAETAEGTGFNTAGFQNCKRLRMCEALITGETCDGYRDSEDLTSCVCDIAADNTANGFNRCKNVSRCGSVAQGRNTDAYRDCETVENSRAYATGKCAPFAESDPESDASCYARGYRDCKDLRGCYGYAHSKVAPDGELVNFRNGTAYGFASCENVRDCTAECEADTQYGVNTEFGGTNAGYGYWTCTAVHGCRARVQSRIGRENMPGLKHPIANYGCGFYHCDEMINCQTEVKVLTPDFNPPEESHLPHRIQATGYDGGILRLCDAVVISDKPAGSGNSDNITVATGVPTDEASFCRGIAEIRNGADA